MASNCLRRCLRPSSGSPSVREAFCDRFVKGHEELPGRLAHAFAQEFPKPCLNLFLLGVMGADVRGEIWDLFFRVTKGIKSRVARGRDAADVRPNATEAYLTSTISELRTEDE